MGTLNIGRVGLDVQITDPGGVAGWSSQASSGRTETISGYLRSSSLAETEALRTELLEQRNRLIAVTWSVDDSMDGFYIQQSASIGASVEQSAFTGVGFHPFSVTLQRIGTTADTEFQSLITGTVLTNDHGLIDTEVQPFHAPPAGSTAYANSSTGMTRLVRTSADGALDVFLDTDFDQDPSWAATPADYYDGAARIYVTSRLRAGLSAPNNPVAASGWELSNGLVKVTPSSTAGRIDVAHYDGTQWETAKTYALVRDIGGGDSKINSWTHLSILRNDAEACAIRLQIPHSLTSDPGFRHTFDLRLRRASRFVEGYWSTTAAAATMKIERDSNEAATAVTPTGATSAVGLRATSNDGDGNRYVLMTPNTHTADTTTGGLDFSNVTAIHFAIGSEIAGSSAVSGDTAADLMLQFLAGMYEVVRAIPR